jgi:acetolactate synthase regulatory subunit
VELKKDLFRISYDPSRVTPERMLETIRRQGFRAKVVTDTFANASSAGNARRDLDRLPEKLRKEVQKAKMQDKPLLLAFHGPG